jgi:hypothetical protein
LPNKGTKLVSHAQTRLCFLRFNCHFNCPRRQKALVRLDYRRPQQPRHLHHRIAHRSVRIRASQPSLHRPLCQQRLALAMAPAPVGHIAARLNWRMAALLLSPDNTWTVRVLALYASRLLPQGRVHLRCSARILKRPLFASPRRDPMTHDTTHDRALLLAPGTRCWHH